MEEATTAIVDNESTAAHAAATQVMAGKCVTMLESERERGERERARVCMFVHARMLHVGEESLIRLFLRVWLDIYSSGQLGFP